jgi:ATP-dependent RNA helicase RhlE
MSETAQTQRMNFSQMGLIDPLLKALNEEGYHTPTPIQVQSIPPVLEGRDLFGAAQTGTGKTAAFSLPILQRLSAEQVKGQREIRCLILAPTRELAIQIGESIRAYGRHLPLRHAVIFGGVGQRPQVDEIRRGLDILVATPGRLQDLHNQGLVKLSHVSILVLDEADRMLDMGFIHDVRRIIALLPAKRQTLLFSATLPKEIRELMTRILHNPALVEVTPVSTTAERIDQEICYVKREEKRDLLEHVIRDTNENSVLVFTRTKHGADKVARDLSKRGIGAEAIHGNKSQNARQRALGDFKDGKLRVLVATDIAARGIDVEELGLVVNFDLPDTPETYVHRIGRTGRAGASGLAVSFCSAEDEHLLIDIRRHLKQPLSPRTDHPFHAEMPAVPLPAMNPQQKAKKYREDGDRPGAAQGGRGNSTPGRPNHSARPGNGRSSRNSRSFSKSKP